MIQLLGLVWRLVATCLMALLGLAASFWLWSGSAGSLATTLGYALLQLPTGQTGTVGDVSGSLRNGGHIGQLRWQGLGFEVEASDVTVSWDWRGLLQRELRLTQLSAARVVVTDSRPPSPVQPLGDLSLPLRVDAQLAVTELSWRGLAPLRLQQLAGHYVFDSEKHRLDNVNVRISSGNYQMHGTLQARAPQALSLTVSGTVQTQVPSIAQVLNLQAQASLDGALAGADAEVQLQARLQPSLASSPTGPVQAEVQARLRPWQTQPVASAQASWHGLDLAALWPQAPHTLSSGRATVTPSGPGWRAEVQLDNRRSASLDRQGLPLEQLQAALMYRDDGWLIESVLASGAGGRMEGRGSYSGAGGPGEGKLWRGAATLHNINPQALHSQLPAANLDGQITAGQSGAGLDFTANLQARASRTADQHGLARISQRVKAIGLDGHWQAPHLRLDRLDLQTDEARLEGQLELDTQRRAGQGQLKLALPGGNAQLHGALASDAGAGEFKLTLTQVALAARWLAQWPGMASTAADLPSGGELKLDGQWQGGWQNFERDLRLTLALRAPRLDLPGPDPNAPGWQLRDLQAELSGRLNGLDISAQALSLRGEQRLQVQTRGRAAQRAEGHWQLLLEQAQLGVQDPALPGRWTMQLAQGMTLDWRQRAGSHSVSISAGSLSLSGPAPGTAQVVWQPAQWSRRAAAPAEPAEWDSQGRIDGLPLAWLELLGQTRIANLGLRGNLVFGGQWDARGGPSIKVSASLERTSGDLRLLPEEVQLGTLGAVGNVGELNAGVREARLRLLIDGAQLKALLDWDSERAGQAQAELGSMLQAGPDGWRWPAEAPLSGTLKVQLPPVGAWSLLAPPGWRLRGTLDADATLSGTRAAPLWRGRLQAQDLAVRSVADGIDFSQGQLRVRLDGQSLDIEEFSLRGAPLAGSSGGTVSVTGSVRWPMAEGRTPTPLLSRLRMDLVAQARSLRVSARVDRRLVVSGQLKTTLEGDQLALRGALTADQALFILPEDNAPQLGDDVKVRRPGTPAVTGAPAKTPVVLAIRPDVLLTLDLGQDFQVRGRGLSTRVAGSVTLRNAGERSLTPLLRGELRAVQGSYRAYGQQLEIEAGVLRFAGPYDNPALDILAIRPNLSQRVGVQITGTAIAPVVRLYAEPELPEAEKLAWLVLGRSAGTGGAEAAVLQQAALALLGGTGRGLPGSLGQALGLDEVTMRGSTSNADGTTTGASVTLGKRLSRDFYVAYERSLAGTLGTLYIFFDLSRRLTLRAQTGEQSAVDLIFTLRYD